ncbi:helix-turn-helix transcriptional regulator [Polaromonas sp.]|uniref:helix-turn-helix transcriptional regulator n=1 Tax=Polaromonas sp. TaxID=1869339 RepID=UPI00375073E8
MAVHDQWTMIRALLNAMGYAALVCDAEGAVVVANDAAFEFLRSADGITLKGDRLQLQDIGSQRRFRVMLDRSKALPGPAPGSTAHPTGPDAAMIAVRPSGKAALQLILRKLQAHQTLLQLEGADRFVLTISDPTSVTVPQIRAISLMYALTPAECRLAQLLLRGATLSEAASELDVSLETVRSQLKSIFSRTNTSRQTELVALLKSAVVLR